MGYGIEFDHERKLIVFRSYGRVDLRQLIEAFRTTARHPDFDPRYHTLCDFRELKDIALLPQELLPLLMEMKSADRREGRTAIIVGDNREHLSMARVFEKLADSLLQNPHQVFEDPVEAEVWLGVRDMMAALH